MGVIVDVRSHADNETQTSLQTGETSSKRVLEVLMLNIAASKLGYGEVSLPSGATGFLVISTYLTIVVASTNAPSIPITKRRVRVTLILLVRTVVLSLTTVVLLVILLVRRHNPRAAHERVGSDTVL